MAAIDLKHADIILKDKNGIYITVVVGQGTFTYSERRNIEVVKSRGELDTIREGDEEPADVSFEFRWNFIMADSGDPPTVEDVLKQQGNAAGWVSTANDTDAPYCIDIEVQYNPPCPGVKKEVILLSQFNYTQLAHDIKQATVAVSGTCNITKAEITRV